MRLTRVDDLKENEIIARDVITPDFKVLITSDTAVSSSCIRLFKANNVFEVYVKDESDTEKEEIVILKEEVQQEVHGVLQKVLEKHTYSANNELSELCGAADTIISNIIQEEDVVSKLYDIKQRSADVYEHSISVCSISTLIALKMDMDKNIIHDIAVACLLHELGLKYIKADYVNKEIYNMTDEEAADYRKHPIYAYSALQDEDWLTEDAKQIILYHHERIDGSGYPMKTSELPDHCKIVQVCDVFDEYICGIGCERVKIYEALEYLKIYKGTRYDRTIVDHFLELVAVYPVGSYVKTNQGETAVVLRQNRSFPDRPVIRIIKDSDGNPVKSIIIKDLLKNTTVFIEDAE